MLPLLILKISLSFKRLMLRRRQFDMDCGNSTSYRMREWASRKPKLLISRVVEWK
jgi:hypothetical protein